MKNLNATLEKISVLMHKRTGYSLRHAIIEASEELRFEYPHDFFRFNSPEWETFILLLEEACK